MLDQTGEYKFLVVSGDIVLETYNINVVGGTATFASASSNNTTITYNDTANISQAEYANNCLGITIAAGDTVTLNREFTLGAGASSAASISSYRLFAFSLEDWTRAEYVGKELLITVTSTKDSSKYFTILFKLGSTNIIALARYGGIAEDKIVDGKGLYDKKVYLLSDAGSGWWRWQASAFSSVPQ